MQQYFGKVPKPAKPVPRDIPAEPPMTKEKRVTVEEAWPLPAVVVAYHITYDGNPDSYPLHMASKILSDGQSSRIYRKLVYEYKMQHFGGLVAKYMGDSDRSTSATPKRTRTTLSEPCMLVWI